MLFNSTFNRYVNVDYYSMEKRFPMILSVTFFGCFLFLLGIMLGIGMFSIPLWFLMHDSTLSPSYDPHPHGTCSTCDGKNSARGFCDACDW